MEEQILFFFLSFRISKLLSMLNSVYTYYDDIDRGENLVQIK